MNVVYRINIEMGATRRREGRHEERRESEDSMGRGEQNVAKKTHTHTHNMKVEGSSNDI